MIFEIIYNIKPADILGPNLKDKKKMNVKNLCRRENSANHKEAQGDQGPKNCVAHSVW